MKSLRKILIILLVIIILGIGVIQTIRSLFEQINVNGNVLFGMLNKLTDSIIVNAQVTDNKYAGNLFVGNTGWSHNVNEIEVIKCGFEKLPKQVYIPDPLEISVNDGEFFDENNGDTIIESNQKVNTVVVKDKKTGDIVLEGVTVVSDDEYSIAIQKTVAFNDYEGGNLIVINHNFGSGALEYSTDNGITYKDIAEGYSWIKNPPNIFEDITIIRKKASKEILYKSPTREELAPELIEDYSYENGKTTLKFKLPETADDTKAVYSYIINGEEKNGTEITANDNTNVKLKLANTKEFMNYAIEDDVTIEVVKIEKPTIEKTDDDLIKITAGEVKNDELKKVYYSVDDGPYKVYKKELKLPKGNHTIKAYQLSKDKKVISDETKLDVTITKDFDAIDEDDDEEIDSDILEIINRKGIQKASKNNNIEKETTTNTNTDTDLNINTNGDTNLNINKEEKKNTNQQSKTQITNSPKTSDNIFIFVVIIISIVTLNAIITKKNKKKNK